MQESHLPAKMKKKNTKEKQGKASKQKQQAAEVESDTSPV